MAAKDTPTTPMSLDALAKLESVPDGSPPPELGIARTYLTPITGMAEAFSDGAPQNLALSSVEARHGGVAGFEMPSGQFTAGLTVIKSGVAELPTSKSETPAELAPYRPEWSGVDYLPRSAPPRAIRALRRRNGTRVTPEYVFGNEDRQPYYPAGFPWRCIGRLFVWDNAANPNWSWSGSAALVSNNAILTCSHNAPWGTVAAGGQWKALFISAYYDGASLNGDGGSAWITGLWGYQNHAQGDDMAVMALNVSLGSTLGHFGFKTYDSSWEDNPWWTKCGYPGDAHLTAGARPHHVTGFPIQDDDNDGAGVELEYEADSSPGDSGGPVFGWWDNGPHIIGTHSGGEEEAFDTNNVAAGGNALTDLIWWARNNWG